MRIAYLAPEFYNTWGGVGMYSLALLRNLALLSDTEVHVIAPDVEDGSQKERVHAYFGDVLHKKKLIIHTLSTARDTFLYNAKFQFALLRKFFTLHSKYAFDIVHSANIVHMPDIFLTFFPRTIPHCVTGHSTIGRQVGGFLQSKKNVFKLEKSEKGSLLIYPFLRIMEWWYLKRSTHLISVSHHFTSFLRNSHKYKGKITTIPNSVDTTHFHKHAITKRQALERFPALTNIQGITLLFVGRIIALKGIDVLLQSVSFLQKNNVPCTCILAGMGDVHLIETAMKKYHLSSETVRYVGFVPNKDLTYLYTLADIFVLPSYSENFPITLLEAMAMECCAVASNVGAIPEIIGEGQGLLFPAGNVHALSEILLRLSKNSSLRTTLAKKGYAKIHTHFSQQEMARQTYSVYQEIIADFHSLSVLPSSVSSKFNMRSTQP